ncbi:MAG: TerC family protein [Phycisphaeraceae bacterium]|nr:TerC family protein [Phycisphaeraceae bacterium]
MLDMLVVAEAGVAVESRVWAYALFIGLIAVFLALDLGVFHRHAHEVSMREAAGWSVVWLSLGLAFSVFVYFAYEREWLGLGDGTAMYNPAAATDASAPLIVLGDVGGAEAAKQYLTGYVVEKSLAMDNIFVIALVFGYLAVPRKYQHRVLFWGIVGALLMRGAMIYIGAELVTRYTWVLIIFGLFLLATSAKMALIRSESDPGNNPLVKLARRFLPVTTFFDGQRFITRRTLPPTYSRDPVTGRERQDPPPAGSLRARWAITPLFLALVLVEFTDLIFAVDSIPAIFAITPDPFIVFTSNIFAILGLRALYFCLAAMIARFRFLKPALILILAFVGVKLLLMSLPPYLPGAAAWFGLELEPMRSMKINTTVSLGVVLGVLAAGVFASVLRPASEGRTLGAHRTGG